MVNNTVFLNESWVWPVLVGAIMLVVTFLWKDLAQTGKHRIYLKSALALLAITSLVLIALRPGLPSSRAGNNYALLTPGYESQQLDSLKREMRKLRVVNYEPGVSLPGEISSAENTFLLGQGIKEFDLWQLNSVPVTYLKSEIPPGIIKLKYQFENRVGDNLILKGLYNEPEEGNLLVLEGPGGAGLDSLVLTDGKEMQVQLQTPLKASGKYVYSLVEKDAKGRIVNNDLLPVKVSEKEHLRILIVNSFPTFETRYLKNFLAEAGHEVIIKSQVTRGRYKFEYLNTERIAISNISGVLLEPFDLLIADASSLRGFSGGEISAIEDQVRENGLGLFIQPDEKFFNSRGKLNALKFERNAGGEITGLQWPALKLYGFPYRIKKDFEVTAIHTAGNSMVAAYKVQGEGRIGTAVYFDTWQLVLEGKNEIYKELWSRLIEKMSKKEVSKALWNSAQTIVKIDEPFQFELSTENVDPRIKTGTGFHIPLMQNARLPYKWKGITWPKETGWNSLVLDTISKFDFYVQDNSSWRVMAAIETMRANERYFKPAKRTGKDLGTLVAINPLWFFSIFLLCMGGLWLEPKI
ncbi:MAG: hypothetical protein ABJ092_16065 [Gillisia sp.]